MMKTVRIMCVGPTHPDMQSPGRVFDPGRGKRKDGGDGGDCEHNEGENDSMHVQTLF